MYKKTKILYALNAHLVQVHCDLMSNIKKTRIPHTPKRTPYIGTLRPDVRWEED